LPRTCALPAADDAGATPRQPQRPLHTGRQDSLAPKEYYDLDYCCPSSQLTTERNKP
jgi:hypothetical protein